MMESREREITSDKALEILKEGNRRFVNNLRLNRDILQQVRYSSRSPHPFATVLSCTDSRNPVELIFDLGIGDVCSIRVAGNIVNTDILRSIELACNMYSTKLIVVLGHTDCIATKTTLDNLDLEHDTKLFQKIQVSAGNNKSGSKKDYDHELDHMTITAKRNVVSSMNNILQKSKTINNLVLDKKAKIVGGLYNVESREVDIFEL